MIRTLIPFFCLILLLGACRAPKDVVYFQGLESLTDEQKAAMNQKYNPKICIDDMLIINVTSPDRTSSAPYNPPPYGYYKPGEYEIGISATTTNLYTYLVDEEGFINFPVLGRVRIAGLTLNEANRKMEELIKGSVPNVLVNVQIANFKVGIFGEVTNADIYTIKGTRISVLELIAKAGSLTINADRTKVWLIRDNNGDKEYIPLDLTDPQIFGSPYFYLQQNDLVVVNPNEAQARNSRYSNDSSFRFSILTSIVAMIVSVVGMVRSF